MESQPPVPIGAARLPRSLVDLDEDDPVVEAASIRMVAEWRSGIQQQELCYEDRLVAALLERSRYAMNEVLYRPAKSVRPTATTEGLDIPLGIDGDASFLDYFLKETEKVQSMLCQYALPEQFPFSDGLPPPVLPLQKHKHILRANSINMNDRIKNAYEKVLLRLICAREPSETHGSASTVPRSEDAALGQSLQCDIECLQALSNYIHHAKFDAEVKFLQRKQDFSERVQRQDADGLRQQLEVATNNQAMLGRMYTRACQYGMSQKFHPLGAQTRHGAAAQQYEREREQDEECDPEENQGAAADMPPAASHEGALPDSQRAGTVERILRVFNDHVLELRLECQVGYLLERLRGLQVAYLGPSGTYSHHAVLSYFSNTKPYEEGSGQTRTQAERTHLHAVPCRNVGTVFRMVVANHAQFGVVPIENSHTGISSTTRDLLVQGALNVTGEIYIPVQHHLLSHCENLKGKQAFPVYTPSNVSVYP
jgi:chorismate mutase